MSILQKLLEIKKEVEAENAARLAPINQAISVYQKTDSKSSVATISVLGYQSSNNRPKSKTKEGKEFRNKVVGQVESFLRSVDRPEEISVIADFLQEKGILTKDKNWSVTLTHFLRGSPEKFKKVGEKRWGLVESEVLPSETNQ